MEEKKLPLLGYIGSSTKEKTDDSNSEKKEEVRVFEKKSFDYNVPLEVPPGTSFSETQEKGESSERSINVCSLTKILKKTSLADEKQKSSPDLDFSDLTSRGSSSKSSSSSKIYSSSSSSSSYSDRGHHEHSRSFQNTRRRSRSPLPVRHRSPTRPKKLYNNNIIKDTSKLDGQHVTVAPVLPRGAFPVRRSPNRRPSPNWSFPQTYRNRRLNFGGRDNRRKPLRSPPPARRRSPRRRLARSRPPTHIKSRSPHRRHGKRRRSSTSP